jgi:hypothetical protein
MAIGGRRAAPANRAGSSSKGSKTHASERRGIDARRR